MDRAQTKGCDAYHQGIFRTALVEHKELVASASKSQDAKPSEDALEESIKVADPQRPQG